MIGNPGSQLWPFTVTLINGIIYNILQLRSTPATKVINHDKPIYNSIADTAWYTLW